MPATIWYDEAGNPEVAVLPYKEYLALAGNKPKPQRSHTENAMSNEPFNRHINLPHSGGQRLDMGAFIKFWIDEGITQMAISARAQSLDKFKHEEANYLDPIIRRGFLRANSPYQNTMQAVTEVVDAITATGVFSRTKIKVPLYYRPVNAIEIDVDKAKAFLKTCVAPLDDLPPKGTFVRP